MTRFRDLRMSKGYTQEEFRKLYNEQYNRNYTSAAISMIEHGKRMPELGALVDFADFYGVSLDYLLGRAGDMDNTQISLQLKQIAENLADKTYSDKYDGEDTVEGRERIEMLRCLLQQSAVLAKHIEKDVCGSACGKGAYEI